MILNHCYEVRYFVTTISLTSSTMFYNHEKTKFTIFNYFPVQLIFCFSKFRTESKNYAESVLFFQHLSCTLIECIRIKMLTILK